MSTEEEAGFFTFQVVICTKNITQYITTSILKSFSASSQNGNSHKQT